VHLHGLYDALRYSTGSCTLRNWRWLRSNKVSSIHTKVTSAVTDMHAQKKKQGHIYVVSIEQGAPKRAFVEQKSHRWSWATPLPPASLSADNFCNLFGSSLGGITIKGTVQRDGSGRN